MVLQFPSLLQGLPDPESQEAHLQSRLPRNHLPQNHPLPRSRPLPRNRLRPRIHLPGIHSTLHRIPLLLPHLPPGIHLQNHLRQNRLRRIHLPLQNHLLRIPRLRNHPRLRNCLPNHPGFLFPEFLHLLVLLRFLLQRQLHLLLQTLRPHPQSLRLQTLPLRNHLHPQNPRPPSPLLQKLLQQSLLQVLPQYRPALLLK